MKIAIDEDAWAGNTAIDGFVKSPKGEDPAISYRFVLPNRTEAILAMVVDNGTKIELLPDRSSSHRALKDALGI